MEGFKLHKGEWIYMPARGEVVCVGKGVIAEVIVTGDEDETGRKMAAAPDLLTALQGLIANYDEFRIRTGRAGDTQHEVIISARAAIAKALGK